MGRKRKAKIEGLDTLNSDGTGTTFASESRCDSETETAIFLRLPPVQSSPSDEVVDLRQQVLNAYLSPYKPNHSESNASSVGGESTYSETTWDENENEPEKIVDEAEAEAKREKRRRKKERQKLKKRAKMSGIELERKQSMHRLDVREAVEIKKIGPLESSKDLALHRCPLTTLHHFFQEIACLFLDFMDGYFLRPGQNRKVSILQRILMLSIVGLVPVLAFFWVTAADPASLSHKKYISWLAYWIFLGILSSVGLGTGLHTFILYLGPFIAKVTMAAEECSSLNFPEPPFPHQIVCPVPTTLGGGETPSLFSIMGKVRWESLAWGFGTALGELPPYFVARAARLTGTSSGRKKDKSSIGTKFRMQLESFIVKVGFWGILLCASVPNPLFDLAGITCGHFLVPFTTFAGATVIGKTLVKAQLQMMFVILAFSEKTLNRALSFIGQAPTVGSSLQTMITEFMDFQRATVRDPEMAHTGTGGVLKTASEVFSFVLVLYFLCSIVNGMAQNHVKRTMSQLDSKKTKKKGRRRKKQNDNGDLF